MHECIRYCIFGDDCYSSAAVLLCFLHMYIYRKLVPNAIACLYVYVATFSIYFCCAAQYRFVFPIRTQTYVLQ